MNTNGCPQKARVSAFYDNELPAEVRGQVQTHLSLCGACQAELESLRRLSVRLTGMRTPAAAADMASRIRKRLAAQEERGLLHVAQAMMGIAAAIMIAAFVGLRMIHSTPAAVEPNPDWAVAAEHPSGDVAGAGQQTVLAQWIVDDLAERNDGGGDTR